MIISKKNDVYVKVDVEPNIGRELVDFFTFEVPGARFMPTYKNRVWDGKIRLYNQMTGEIYFGLVPYVEEFANRNDIKIEFNNKKYLIESLENFDPQTAQIIIFSAGSTVAEKYARDFVAAGSFVVDLSSNFRYQDDVPLIIPEINGDIIESLSKPSLIANPNCSTAQLLMALKPIHDNAKIKFLNIATYQAVSGTGKAALEELHNQTYFKDSENESVVYPKQIAFNVIPQCDIFLENNFTKEEMKLTWETHKILDSSIRIQATCVRVPVYNGHSEAVFFKVSKDMSREEIITLLEDSAGIKVLDDPKEGLSLIHI